MSDIFTQTVVRVRAGTTTDRGGNTVQDWSPAAVDRLTVDRVSVQPNYQREDADDISNRRATGYRVLSEPGTTPDITAIDRLEYRGDLFDVDGEVAYWPDPDGEDHIELTMSKHRG